MTDTKHSTESVADACWPGFLDLVDSNPRKAAEGLYRFVYTLFRTAPPRILRSLPTEKHQDLMHDIVVHCIKQNLRVLRQYQNKGRPFAVWFYFIARNLILDSLDRERQTPTFSDPSLVDEAAGRTRSDQSLTGNPIHQRSEMRQTLEAVNSCLEKIGDYCRALLRMAGDELVPREMTKVFGWPKDKAKKVSNDLGYCRKKLENMLVEYGLDIEELKSRV